MSVKNVGSTPPPKYFVEPQKSKTGRAIMSSIGLAGAAGATGYLLNDAKSPFNPLVIANELKATGVDFLDKHNNMLKKVKFSRYLPLGLGLGAGVLALYGLGSAIDTGIHNRRIKKALKRSLEFQEQENTIKKQNLDVKC